MFTLFRNDFLLSIFLLVLNPIFWHSASAQMPTVNTTQHSAPQRIISLAPHITEMVFSAGAGDRLVGVVAYSDYPKAALDIAIIGGYQAVNIEKIIQLNPDLILAWKTGNRSADIEKLEKLGFTIGYSNPRKLTDISKEIRHYGQLFETQSQANRVASQLEQILQSLKRKQSQLKPVKAYYQIWNHPLMTINGEQFISQAINLCGAQNIFANLPMLVPEVSIESVMKADPEVILLGGLKKMQQGWLKDWQKWGMISAVKNAHIYPLQADTFQRPTARLINGIDDLCEIIDQAR
mgnify:CR=1 FL=1